MNRIYRVIYNQAKNCYVVTSEFARAHTKSAGKATRSLVIAAMTAGALLSGAGMSFAALSTTEVSTSAGGTATVLSGEPSDVVTDVSGVGATLTVTKGDGSSTTVVVNNVANATEAEKAVSDKDGNDISTTYLKTADAETTYATKTELAGKADTADVYSKTDADATFATKTELATKADKTEVYTRTEADETFATKTALQEQADHDQANANALSGALNNGLAVDGNNVLQKITSSVDSVGNVTTSVNPADTLIINKDGTNKVTIDTTGLSVGAGSKMDANGVYAGGSNSTDAAAALNADGSIKGASGKFTVDTSGNLNTHAGKISTEGGSINTGAGDINTAGGQILTAGGTINTSGGSIIGGAITGTSLNTQGGDIIGGNITATGLNTQGGAISSGDINSTGAIHASGKITGNGLDANGGSITGGSLSVTGSMAGHDLTLSGGNLNAGSGTISTTGNVEAGNITSTGTIKTSNLEVTGDFATDHMTIGHETNNKTDINKGNISAVNGVITTNIADQSVKASTLTFTEDGYKVAVAGHGATSNSGASTEVTMNGVTNTSIDSLGNSSAWSQTSKGQTATTTDSTGARSQVAQSSSQYGSSIYDSSGNLKSYITQRMEQIIQGVTDGTTTTTIDQGPANITNTASNGSITNQAMTLVNNATTDMTNTVGGKLVNNVTGNMENTVGGDLKNEVTGDVFTKGKNITNQAADSIVDKVGENVSRTMTGNKITDIVKGTDGTTNTVNNEASGTTFENSAHNAPIEEGTITKTTIAGNTVETGRVTMDYAEVKKDLGVRGNAAIDGNTSVGGTLGVTGKATFHDDVDIAKNLSVAGNASVTGDVTAASFKVGTETYISAEGINANNKKITNVAPGELSLTSMDAVNGSQLYDTNQRVSRLDSRLDKVGANAAALANLNPLEFDKDTKLNMAAAVGNYKDETAVAVGVYYRPNEDVMLGVSTSFGTGENMVGGGISVRVGHGGNKSARAATENAIKENEILRQEVKSLEARMDALFSILNPNMSKEFPDVPANHWAYEAVSRLAGNGIIEGYEDGKYHGERQMTRYEMAEIIFKALSKGAQVEKGLVDEFHPELQAMAASNKA
ncbi:ESPR-type extended signal peptide-containing protein [Allisonella histaminiformans]|uniref:ESPR-type extended signal peptide-containing protein n=2 Tax=Allisonella TaxID=209879 RepID=UPI002E79CC0A|nr:ESPR-type extended signal peptide-containing protein [Allisonella histaminiformans]